MQKSYRVLIPSDLENAETNNVIPQKHITETGTAYEAIDRYNIEFSKKYSVIEDYGSVNQSDTNNVSDEHEAKDSKPSTTFFWTVFNLWNDVLGTGMVGTLLIVKCALTCCSCSLLRSFHSNSNH